MLFNSLIFLFLFLPVTLAGFVISARLGRATLWLFLASLVFYAYWKPIYLVLVLASILFNYGMGLWLLREREQPRRQKKVLLLGVSVNLLLLGYYKYAHFFIGTVNSLAGLHLYSPHLILPLAISFYTFTEIAYLVDIYKGELLRHSFLDYCLFVTFFPHLIAGPIVRSHEILPQITDRKWRLETNHLAIGLTIFIIGLFEKMVLADALAVYADPIFNAAGYGTKITFVEAWVGALAYTLQIYFDFSGYSNMAIGLARLFGIKFPLNFNSPYQAVNMIDFWRRWHVTLSRFLRDYLYIPLGGNRKGKPRQYVNLMTTMLLGGLWHGASWTFVFWGGLHGLYLAVNHGYRALSRKVKALGTVNKYCPVFVSRSLTFLCVVVGWVFFRATSWGSAFSLLHTMSGREGLTMPALSLSRIQPLLAHLGFSFSGSYILSYLGKGIALVFFGLVIAGFFPNAQQWMVNTDPVLEPEAEYHRPLRFPWKPTVAAGFIMALMLFLVLKTFFKATPTQFLYFNF